MTLNQIAEEWDEITMRMKGMKKEKYETCIHSTGDIGQLVVYVKPGCPQLCNIKGTLCASKNRCRECKSWKKRDD